MQTKFSLVIYPKAAQDMERIFDYISNTLNSPQAACMIAMLQLNPRQVVRTTACRVSPILNSLIAAHCFFCAFLVT